MSRRNLIQMTDEEIDGLLTAQKTMILVSNGADGFPHPMPMWFARDPDGSIRMTTYRSSQKIKNLERDPRVALLVEAGTEYSQLKGVVLYGRAELLHDVDLAIDTMLRASRASEGLPSDPSQADALRSSMQKSAEKRCVIRVKPERIVSWDHAKLGGSY